VVVLSRLELSLSECKSNVSFKNSGRQLIIRVLMKGCNNNKQLTAYMYRYLFRKSNNTVYLKVDLG